MERFIKSDLFTIILFLVAITNWYLQWTIGYLAVMFVVGIFILYRNYSRIYMIPLAIASLIAFYQPRIDIPVYIMGGLIVLLACYDFIKNRIKQFNPVAKSMFLFLLFMGISMLYTVDILSSVTGIIHMLLFIYVWMYFSNIEKKTKQSYVIRVVIYFSFALFIEIVLGFIQYWQGTFLLTLADLNMGWGRFSEISFFYLISIPLTTVYYLRNEVKLRYLFILFFQISMVVLFASRGAYIALLVCAIPYCVLTFRSAINKIRLIKTFLIYIIIALVFRLLVSNPTGMTMLWYERITFFAYQDQQEIFAMGLQAWRLSPLFGNGVLSSVYFLKEISQSIGYELRYFPNYLVHTIVTLGIFGLLPFSHFVYQLFNLLKEKTQMNRYLFILLLIVFTQGLFDTTFYGVIVMITLLIMLSIADFPNEKSRKDVICTQSN
ncbi:MAG: O-antigen ligase family protein [Bacilli bacterium]|jgi:hypothetical protein|nr:O-antigen ligase family protein [Bacilli bacterium]MDY0063457.1 O-antigen ligase family protein [Bacilli bacterium]